MFKSKEKPIEDQIISTIINTGFTINGDLSGDAVVRIDGTVRGNVYSEMGVILGEKGRIEGDIKAKSIIIYGYVQGVIDAECLEIKSTGRVLGDIKTLKLEVQMGGVYNGKLQMTGGEEISNSEVVD